jgi:predicted MFS family arabinose efflux permease
MVGAGFAMAMTAPFELIYADGFGIGPTGMFLFILSTFVGMIAIDVFGTRFVPHVEARVTLAAGIGTFGLSCAILGLAPGLAVLLAGRIVQGFGAGLLMGAGLQAAVRVTPDERAALGAFNGSFLLGAAFGAPVGGLVAAVVPGGYRVTFLACTFVCAVLTAALWRRLPRLVPPAGARRPRLSLPRLSGPPGMGLALVLGMTGDFIRGGVVYTALPLAGADRDLSPMTIGIAVGLLSAVEILVLARAAPIIRRVGLVPCLVVSLALGVGCSALLAATTGWLPFVAGALLFGLVVAGATVGPPLVIVALTGDAASGLATFRIASGVGMLVGATGVGVIASAAGTAVVFVLVATVLLAGIGVAIAVGRRLTGKLELVAQGPDSGAMIRQSLGPPRDTPVGLAGPVADARAVQSTKP